MKISELTEPQKEHLAWRLDHNTWCGYLTAGRVARGEMGDMEIEETFMKFDKSKRSAKILAKKVMDFTIDPDVYAAQKCMFRVTMQAVALCRQESAGNENVFKHIVKNLSKDLLGFLDSYIDLVDDVAELQKKKGK